MNLLLDTHAFMWFINGDKSLPAKVINLIKNIENKCFISIASIWEIAIKFSLGRLDLEGEFGEISNFLNENDIEIMSSGKLRPKKADAINSELAKQGVYNKLEQKSVTAWLDLRNKAAHGKHGEYKENQVKQLIIGVRDFIVRNPA